MFASTDAEAGAHPISKKKNSTNPFQVLEDRALIGHSCSKRLHGQCKTNYVRNLELIESRRTWRRFD
jgi:hypothetical protein